MCSRISASIMGNVPISRGSKTGPFFIAFLTFSEHPSEHTWSPGGASPCG